MVNKAAVMTGLNQMVIQERPEPTPTDSQAVVRVEAVGVCGSDATYFTVGRIGDYIVDGPIVLGHEVSGVVQSVGAGVRNVRVGDRVAVEPGTPCRDCQQCRVGRYHLCPNFTFLATPPYDGALLQLLQIDARNLYPIPDEMTFEQGALLEPLSVGIWACKRAGLVPGDHVLITGAGPVGLLSAAVARAFGAASVTVSDVQQQRTDMARAMGFAIEDANEPSGQEFDVLIECSGAPGALARGLGRLREAGRAAMVGMPKQDAVLPLSQLNPKEITLSLVNRYNDTWPLAIELVASGRVDVTPLITHHFPLEQTAEALLVGRTDPAAVKAFVHPHRDIPQD